MPLIVPDAKLSYLPPWNDGYPEKIGLSRDWTDEKTKPHGTDKLVLRWVDYIEHLKALAPTGNIYPIAMTIGGGLWQSTAGWNPRIRNIIVPGAADVDWVEFYDGNVYPDSGTWATNLVAAKAASNEKLSDGLNAGEIDGMDAEEADAYATPAAIDAFDGVVMAATWTYAARVESQYGMFPNLSIRTIRYCPPAGQHVVPQTGVVVRAKLRVTCGGPGWYWLDPALGVWMDGVVTLVMPTSSDRFKDPFLAWQVALPGGGYSAYSKFAESSITSPVATDVNPEHEYWSIEYIEDRRIVNGQDVPGLFEGGHIIIGHATEKASSSGKLTDTNSKDWVVYNPCVRLVYGTVAVIMAGTIQQVNVSPINYATADEWQYDRDCVAFAAIKNLPDGRWNGAATWGSLKTACSGWNVEVGNRFLSSTGFYSPVVAFVPTAGPLYQRPVVWIVTEDHPDVITVPDTAVADTTENIHLLKGLHLAPAGSLPDLIARVEKLAGTSSTTGAPSRALSTSERSDRRSTKPPSEGSASRLSYSRAAETSSARFSARPTASSLRSSPENTRETSRR